MRTRPPQLLAVVVHTANARWLRARVRTEVLFKSISICARYAVAPFAFGRRKCSPSRGNISTKLHGR
jgi:hypothetical protein